MTRAIWLLVAAAMAGLPALLYTTAKPALIIALLSTAGLTIVYWALDREERMMLGKAPAIIALLLPIAGWLLPSIWLLYALMLLLVPVFATRREDVAPLFLFALLLLPPLQQTISFASIKLVEFGLHEALSLGAAAVLIARPGWRSTIRPATDLPFAAIMILLVGASARDTTVTNLLRVLLNTSFACLLPYYIVSRGVRDGADVKRCMIHLTLAAVVLSVLLWYEQREWWPIYNELYDHYGMPAPWMAKSRGGSMRPGGPFLEPTSIAMVLAFCLLATWLLRDAFRSRLHHLSVTAMVLAGMAAPQSRGAWIGVVIGSVLIDLYRGRLRATLTRLAIIGVLGAGLMTVAHQIPWLAESLGQSGGAADTVDYRERLLDRGMEEFWHRPILGYSLPDIMDRLADLKQGEGIVDFVNTYLYIALVSGIVGVTVFVGAFLAALLRLWRDRRHWRRSAGGAEPAAFVFGSLAMPMEMLAFTSLGGRPETFILIFFALAAALSSALKTTGAFGAAAAPIIPARGSAAATPAG